MKEYIEVGEMVTTHGVLGEVKLYPWCDGPEFVAKLPRLFFTKDGGKEMKLEKVRAQKGMCLLKIAGINNIDEARPLLRKTAYFKRSDAKLPKGRYFVQDIIGCTVQNAASGEVYGTIEDITHPAAIDIYTIKNEAGETFLFPAVAEFLGEIDPEKGIVTVNPIEGMFSTAGGSDDED